MFVHDSGTKFLNNVIVINNKTGTILNSRRTDSEVDVLRHGGGSRRLSLIPTDVLGKLNYIQKSQLADKFQISCRLL